MNAGVAAGTTTVSGNVTALGSGTGAALTVNNAATGLVDFQGTFAGNSGLSAGAATSVKFGQNVTLGNGDTATNLAGAVTLDGLTWSSNDGVTFGATTLSTAAGERGLDRRSDPDRGDSRWFSEPDLEFGGSTGAITVTGAVTGVGTLRHHEQ